MIHSSSPSKARKISLVPNQVLPSRTNIPEQSFESHLRNAGANRPPSMLSRRVEYLDFRPDARLVQLQKTERQLSKVAPQRSGRQLSGAKESIGGLSP